MSKKIKTTLRETTFSESLNIDREAGVIRNVRILGRDSKNGRTYSDQAVSDAVKLYEGRKVFIDHPDRANTHQERRLVEFFGELREVKSKDGGVFGDLHFVKSHPLAETVVESAERFPNQFGMSHNAEGETRQEGGKIVVESLTGVRSVDIVTDPATNAGLFESVEVKMPKIKTTLREIVRKFAGKKGVKILEQEAESEDPVLDPEMEVEVASEGEGSSSDEQMKAAFMKKIEEIINDDGLDMKATINAVKAVLKSMAETIGLPGEGGGEAEEQPAEAATEEEPVAESIRKLRAENDRLKKQEKARQLLESKGRKATGPRIAAVAALSGSDRDELVESWPADFGSVGTGTGQRPTRSASIRESQQPSQQTADPKSWAASLKD